MVNHRRFFGRVVSVVVMLSVTATLFICCSAPVYARVADGSNVFKYASASVFGSDSDIQLTSAQFDYATSPSNHVHFQSYLTERANILSFRMELTDVLNTSIINWFLVNPTVISGNTNITYYQFYIVPRSYDGRITTSIDRTQYIYYANYNYADSTFGKAGNFTLLNESYGSMFLGNKYVAVGPQEPSDGYYPATDQCDLIVQLYSPQQRSDFIVNFNPLVVGNGQGSRPSIENVENGFNELPVPDDWKDRLHNDDELYGQIDIQLNDILDYMSNPATMLNTAMDRTRVGLQWTETKFVLAMVDRFLGLPLVNTVAWALCLFGSVFSLFNLAISFAPTGGGSTPTRRTNPTSYGIQRRHLTQGEYGKRR